MGERNSIAQSDGYRYWLETNQILCYTYQTYVRLAQVRAKFFTIWILNLQAKIFLIMCNVQLQTSHLRLRGNLPAIHFLFTSSTSFYVWLQFWRSNNCSQCSNIIQKHSDSNYDGTSIISAHFILVARFAIRYSVNMNHTNICIREIVLCVYLLMHHRSPDNMHKKRFDLITVRS